MRDLNLFRVEGSVYLKNVNRKIDVVKSDDCDGYLIEASEKEARRIIESLKGSGKKIGVIGGDDAFNRRVVESLKVDYLVSPERGLKFDNLKQRDSGINHVVAKLARDKGISFVVDFSEIAGLKAVDRIARIERIIQNVKICRKAGCGIKIASLGFSKKSVVDKKGREAFGVSLGMSSRQSFDSVRF